MSTSTRRADITQHTTAYPETAQLADLGNIPGSYHHEKKQVSPSSGLALPGGYLKWYDIHYRDTAIPVGTRDQARDFLRSEAASGRLALRGELGFVLLHRCAGEFYFLVVCTWREHNEMWQTVYDRDEDRPFTFHPRLEDHSAAQCVWELGATGHERLAWTHYLGSARDETAKRGYLADTFEGQV